MADEGQSGFLPPEPPGPEPDLGDRGQDPTQPVTRRRRPSLSRSSSTRRRSTGSSPPAQYPPPQQHYPPPQPQPWQHAPYGYGPPPGYGYGPPPGWQQPQWQQPYPAWAAAPREPDNNQAVAGFVLSMVGGGLLFFFAGLSTILSLGLSIAGIVYSRKGREKVDKGETDQAARPGPGGLHHRDRLDRPVAAGHGVLDPLLRARWPPTRSSSATSRTATREPSRSPS